MSGDEKGTENVAREREREGGELDRISSGKEMVTSVLEIDRCIKVCTRYNS